MKQLCTEQMSQCVDWIIAQSEISLPYCLLLGVNVINAVNEAVLLLCAWLELYNTESVSKVIIECAVRCVPEVAATGLEVIKDSFIHCYLHCGFQNKTKFTGNLLQHVPSSHHHITCHDL